MQPPLTRECLEPPAPSSYQTPCTVTRPRRTRVPGLASQSEFTSAVQCFRDSSRGPQGISANLGDPPGNPTMPTFPPADTGSAAGLNDPASFPWTPRYSPSNCRFLLLPGSTPQPVYVRNYTSDDFPALGNLRLNFRSGTFRTFVPAVGFTTTSNSFTTMSDRLSRHTRQYSNDTATQQLIMASSDPGKETSLGRTVSGSTKWNRRHHLISDNVFGATSATTSSSLSHNLPQLVRTSRATVRRALSCFPHHLSELLEALEPTPPPPSPLPSFR